MRYTDSSMKIKNNEPFRIFCYECTQSLLRVHAPPVLLVARNMAVLLCAR